MKKIMTMLYLVSLTLSAHADDHSISSLFGLYYGTAPKTGVTCAVELKSNFFSLAGNDLALSITMDDKSDSIRVDLSSKKTRYNDDQMFHEKYYDSYNAQANGDNEKWANFGLDDSGQKFVKVTAGSIRSFFGGRDTKSLSCENLQLANAPLPMLTTEPANNNSNRVD
jgi:hypothetical protein